MKSETLKNITYGMYAIGVKDGEKTSASIINSVTQMQSSSDSYITIIVNKNSYTASCIKKSGMFTVSVLSEDTPASVVGVLGLISGKKTEKLKNIRHKKLIEGVPVIKENTCCWFLCSVKKLVDFENQTIVLGKIEAGSDVSVGVPMTYEYYVKKLNGTVPKESPNYFKPKRTFDKSSGETFACSVCGYLYNDPDFTFEELGANWTCPVCKMPKAAFIRR